MPTRPSDTQEMLARHHRDGEAFVQLMKESFAGRFNDAFWQSWQQHAAPLLQPGAIMLDLGTGPGLFLAEAQRRHPGIRAVGIEVAPYMLEAASNLPDGCEVISADLHDPNLPMTDNSVAVVLASMVLHELTQPLRLMQEMQRCLQPGGVMVILDWVRAPLDRYMTSEADTSQVFGGGLSVQQLDDLFTHFIEHNRFTADDLAYMLRHTGFEIREQTLYRDDRFARIVAVKR